MNKLLAGISTVVFAGVLVTSFVLPVSKEMTYENDSVTIIEKNIWGQEKRNETIEMVGVGINIDETIASEE